MSPFLKNNRGFTLPELIVTVAIVTTILLVIVLNQSAYTDRLALTNNADEIGLMVSQAQIFGVGVRGFEGGFDNSYGLAFSLIGSASNTSYIYFADRPPAAGVPPDGFYGGDWTCAEGPSSECLEKVEITRGNYVQAICAVGTSSEDCAVGRVDITFVRPNVAPRFLFRGPSSGSYTPSFDVTGTRILLASPTGATTSVLIYATGQISIQ